MTKNLADRHINGENPPSLLALETPAHLKMARIHGRNAKIYGANLSKGGTPDIQTNKHCLIRQPNSNVTKWRTTGKKATHKYRFILHVLFTANVAFLEKQRANVGRVSQPYQRFSSLRLGLVFSQTRGQILM